LNIRVETLIASIREPSDFGGLPVVIEDGVKLAPPLWAQKLVESGEGILFLDEVSCAPPAVQASLLRVVLDKVVGDLKLPDSIKIIAAANPPEIAAGGWDLAPPLANRFLHINWKLDPNKWTQGMMSGWPTPKIPRLAKNWEDQIAISRGLVASFIQRRQEHLLSVPSAESDAGKAWASPRSWDNASRAWAACESVKANSEVRADLMTGCVGEGHALEFINWLNELDLPDPLEVLKNPDKFKLPRRDDQLFAVISAAISEAVRDLTVERWNAGWKVLGRAAEKNRVDIAAVPAQVLAKARKQGMKAPKDIKHFVPVLRAAGLM
jgi:hypothetical protein